MLSAQTKVLRCANLRKRRVSPGYLSELERGRKEVSSELLASVCHALGATVADVLIEAAGSMAVRSAEADLARV